MSNKTDKVNEVEELSGAVSIEKFPELRRMIDDLTAQKEKIVTKTEPLHVERDAILAEVQPKLDRVRELEKSYRAVEQPRLAEIDNQISALARAMGGRSMSQSET